MSVLDWSHGTFELSAATPADDGQVVMPVTHLLLEHARLRDEASRPIRAPRRTDEGDAVPQLVM